MQAILLMLLVSACASNSGTGSAPVQSNYLQNKGSDTMVNLALAWAERFQNDHPDVSISVTGGGSGTGITALISGTVDIANASRQIKSEEVHEAQENGVEPVEYVVARDAIAIIVNPHNPVDQLSIEQVSDIYTGIYTNWRELGGEDRPIVRLSRETNSGTHVYFLETVIRLGDNQSTAMFAPQTLLLPSSEGIISEVRENPNAIGYDGLGYVTEDVKVLAVSQMTDGAYILPSVETVNDSSYPIARDLFMYSNGQAHGILKEYLDWIGSAEAQEIVIDLGFVPVYGGVQ